MSIVEGPSGRFRGRGPNGEKRCPRCRQILMPEAFGFSKQTSDGLQSKCRPCQRAYARSRYKRPKSKIAARNAHLSKTYGLTDSKYLDMFVSQLGKCAICGIIGDYTTSDRQHRLHVDHCHKTGKVRGLLCINCNQGIGNLKDDEEVLLKAAAYIAKFKGTFS